MKPRHLNLIALTLIWFTAIPTWWKMLNIAVADPTIRAGMWVTGFISMILVGVLSGIALGGMDAITSKD